MRPSFHRPWHPDTPPETCLQALEHAMRIGKRFSRPLTRAERLTIALASVSPHSHLMVPAPGLDRHGAMQAWARLRKRLDRSPKMPLIAYVGTCVRARGAAGWHLHLLLWGGYLYHPQLARHAREAGLGAPSITKIGESAWDRLKAVAYVLGQTEPVFCDMQGRWHHERNDPRAKGHWSLLRPHAGTLRARQPKLLSALSAAEDQSLSDVALRERCPLFTTVSTQHHWAAEEPKRVEERVPVDG